MRRTHKDNPDDTVEYATEMRFWVVLREENGFLAHEAAKTVADEDERAGRQVAEVVEEV